MKNRLTPLFGFVVVVLFWGIGAYIVEIPFLPSPVEVMGSLFSMVLTQRYWDDIMATLFRTGVSFGISTFIGVPLGLVIGHFLIMRRLFEALLDFARSIPATALLPLFLVLLGVGDSGKIALTCYSVTLIIAIYTMLGVANASKERLLYGKTLGASAFFLFTRIVFFDALPSIMSGLRASISLALILVIVAEMVMMGGEYGLGMRLYLLRFKTDYSGMYAMILTCGILGYLINWVLKWLTSRYVHWGQ